MTYIIKKSFRHPPDVLLLSEGSNLQLLRKSQVIRRESVRTQRKELKGDFLFFLRSGGWSAARWKNLDYCIYLHLVVRPPALLPRFPQFPFVFGTRSAFVLHSTTYIRLPCNFLGYQPLDSLDSDSDAKNFVDKMRT